jgi:glutamyl-tRNA synthetase
MILGADKARLPNGTAPLASWRTGTWGISRGDGQLPGEAGLEPRRSGIFTLKELIDKFAIEDVGKSAGVFNPDKLLWLNAHYIKNGDPDRLADLLVPFLEERGVKHIGGPALPAVVKTLKERARTMLEMADGAVFYYKGDFAYDSSAAEKFLKQETVPLYAAVMAKLESLEDSSQQTIEAAFKDVCAELGVKLGQVGPLVRVALCGGTVSPGIYEMIGVLGLEETMKRLLRAREFAANH